jgi:hypothetical protein
MAEALVHQQTPVEFFKEQLARAMEHQRVSTSAFTEYYLVNLLAGYVRGEALPSREPGYDETPLAMLYVRALQASRFERARMLRSLGDLSLFLSGFFSDSVGRKLVDLDYYRAMGGQAYRRLSQQDELLAFGPEVFSELAGRFTEFADVLSEVSEKTHLTTNVSALRLYEKWLQTRSRRTAEMLAERGIAPMEPEVRPQ